MTAAKDSSVILVVEDDDSLREAIVRSLERDGYMCLAAHDLASARAGLSSVQSYVVLIDVRLPDGSGLDLATEIRERADDTFVIMISGVDDGAVAKTAIDNGAYSFVLKPFHPNQISVTVRNALRQRELDLESRHHAEKLQQLVNSTTADLWQAVKALEAAQQELRASREETIYRLGLAAEFRDNETALHIHRMSRYCELLAELAGLDSDQTERIRLASIMHDVGKIGIPDRVLRKPRALTEDEIEVMREHCEIGNRILAGSESDLLDLAATIALTHHERFDGTGFPNGLKGDDIPLAGRIATIADSFDAITSDRVYRKARSVVEALAVMRSGRGTQFDPELLDLFLGAMDQVLTIREEFDDSPESLDLARAAHRRSSSRTAGGRAHSTASTSQTPASP